MEILNLSQQKEETIWYQNKLSYCKVFHRTFLSDRNEKADTLINKPVYLGLLILELRCYCMMSFGMIM